MSLKFLVRKISLELKHTRAAALLAGKLHRWALQPRTLEGCSMGHPLIDGMTVGHSPMMGILPGLSVTDAVFQQLPIASWQSTTSQAVERTGCQLVGSCKGGGGPRSKPLVLPGSLPVSAMGK